MENIEYPDKEHFENYEDSDDLIKCFSNSETTNDNNENINYHEVISSYDLH